ncbi:MAG: translation initiation factor IF-2 [Lachnospiraceae bacterium]|nr:translation initiation factor IF-2 [Lachnospiraceae bacterium]
MAKIKVHELAKELDKQSKDILAFLQEKGIEAKAAQSSVEEDAAQMVRKAFGGVKAEPVKEKKAEEVKQEAPKAEAPKAEVPKADNTKTEEAPKKKKKIIFVSNPQNSKMPGQRPNNGQQPRQGGQQSRPQGNYNNYGNNRAQAPVRPIKPLTPPSPTPSVQMVPGNKNQATQQVQAAEVGQNTAPQAAVREQASVQQNNRPQNTGRVNADRPARDNRYQDNHGQDRNQDNRGRDGRLQGGQYPNRGGMGNNRPQGDRQGGFNRQGRPGMENGQSDRRDGKGKFASGNGGQANRFGDNKPGKGFAGEAPGKDMEKKREEDKRRFSQERDKRSKKDHIYEEEDMMKNKPGRFIKPEKKKEEVVEEVIKVITLPESITIKELADKMKIQPAAIVKKLFLEGKIVTVNQEITYEDAENIAMEYEILCEKEVKVDVIEELLKEDDEDEANLVERPPVICVMGHVDHGKTSLLDAIRKTNVTDREAGGITQHIGAYTVNVGEKKITFLDTPGHEAFTAMRMRGANSTDIAILVVAADDGVMPQTVEAINHAKAAGVEIIVAVNKIDKPSANIDRVKQELSEYELIPEDWGGSTVFAPVSAKSGEGIEQLLEMILLTSEILELKANPKRRARGLVIEAELDKGRGPVATVLVQKGTLHVGDFISAGACHGKVRAMIDDKGRRVREAGPSTPVEILGLSDVPSAGEVFLAHESDKTAKSYAETYLAQNKEKMLEETKGRMSLDDLFSQIQAGNLKELNLIVKADVQGSVEAVKQSLLKLSNEEVVVKCIHGGVGAINESDVILASTSNAIIIGFNVRPDVTAKATAEREGVDVRLYKVIYQAIEDIEAAMKGMLDPIYEEKVIGHAEVRQIFKASAIGNIAGSYVLDGIFQRGCKVRVSREGKQIFEGQLASLKRFKDDVKEVKSGFECGLVFEGFDQMQELDIVEAYIMVEVPR